MLRKANEDDIEVLLDITYRAVEHMNNVDKFNQWDHNYPNRDVFLEDIEYEELYLYVDDYTHEILGFMVINSQVYPAYEQANFSFDYNQGRTIHRVCVDPNSRGREIGLLLMQEAVEISRQDGYQYLIVDTNERNEAMNKVIKKAGYSFVGQMNLKPEQDCGMWNCYEYVL